MGCLIRKKRRCRIPKLVGRRDRKLRLRADGTKAAKASERLGRIIPQVEIDRKLVILKRSLKTPPALNEFNYPVSSGLKERVYDLLNSYRLEDRERIKERKKAGEAAVNSEYRVRNGICCVTRLVTNRKARLVLIPADVTPIEIVVWLPALCRKMEIPYLIVESKEKLGEYAGVRRTAAMALVNVDSKDEARLNSVIEEAKGIIESGEDVRTTWGALRRDQDAE